jgi:4-amino-4-deoxy-L-arabinose transferase-like glycosyltransferase
LEGQASGRLRAALPVAAAVLLLSGLGRIDAWAPDEPRYLHVAEGVRAMEHGARDLVLLQLNGEPYTQKPPLYFWLAALAGAPAGRVGETAARLPSALSGIGVVALTLLLGSRLFGGRIGLLGGLLLLTVFEFAQIGRRIQLDMLLTLFETGALLLFWRVDRGLGPRALQVAGLHALLGLAVLTKGPVGFLVPVLVMVGYLAWERRPRDLLGVVPLWALPLSLGPGLLWVAAATALAPPGFAEEAVGTNVLGRFFAGTSHARPPWYFLYQFPIDFLPWTLLWPAVYWAGRRVLAGDPAAADSGERRAWRFLLAWVGITLAFFSISAGKRGLYMLPAFPAAALLVAAALVQLLAGRASIPRPIAIAFGVLATLLAAVGAAAIVAPTVLRGRPEVVEALRSVDGAWLIGFGCAALAVVAAGVTGWIVTWRLRTGAFRRIGLVAAAVWAFEMAIFQLLYPALDPGRSPRPIAESAAAATPEGERVGLVSDRAMVGGLAHYGARPIAELGSAESIEAFFAEGGRTIVVKARKRDRVDAIRPMEVVGRARHGRREVLVLVPEEAAPPALP